MKTLPASCDVLIVGAGPAGSACAQLLARAGLDTLLVDQHDFPRDKVCGDGLIPDAHAALQRLGVHAEVMAAARRVGHARCVGPRSQQVDVPGTLAVLPRKQLDLIVWRAALAAGARWLAPARFLAPLEEQGRVVGARLRLRDEAGDVEHEVRARWVVLATGAVPQALIAAGLCQRHTPSGVALRGYVRCQAMVERITELEFKWHPRMRGGYGWIFPGPDGVFNIGVGLTDSHAVDGEGRGRKRGASADGGANLRQMLSTFCEVHPPAAELMAQGEVVGEFKGAPLRCSMNGARWSRPGLLVTGEAAGSTYAFTGEGIGKALETGMLAAEALLHTVDAPDAEVQARFEASLQALVPRFVPYEKATHVNRRPWLIDLVIWRARRSPRILRRMSGVLEETQSPGRLFSWRGITKLLFE